MRAIRRVLQVSVLTLAFGVVSAAVPSNAHAFKLGLDAIWVPVGAHEVKEKSGPRLRDDGHEVGSWGLSAQGELSFEYLSGGLKVNYFNEGLDLVTADRKVEDRRKEIDVNVMGRLQVPQVALSVFGETGLVFGAPFEKVGFNAGFGVEYTLFTVSIVGFNLGLAGQYTDFDTELRNQPVATDSWRFSAFAGLEFGM